MEDKCRIFSSWADPENFVRGPDIFSHRILRISEKHGVHMYKGVGFVLLILYHFS